MVISRRLKSGFSGPKLVKSLCSEKFLTSFSLFKIIGTALMSAVSKQIFPGHYQKNFICVSAVALQPCDVF